MDIGRLIRNARLPSPAPVVLKLYEVLDHGAADDIARVIDADPALAARLLRLANSAFYAPPPVATVRDAVVRIGTTELAALALATEVMRIFRGIPSGRLNMQAFWAHSLWTACYSEALAVSSVQPPPVPLWLCGLLHDVGRLLLARQASSDYAAVLERVDGGVPLLEAEAQVLGFTHARLGAELLAAWQLPETLVECAARHHDAYAAADMPWSIVAAANEIADQQRELKDLPGMTAENIEQVKTAARERYARYRQLFSENFR